MPSTKQSDFLSATYTGPQGPQGPQGATGPQGPQGPSSMSDGTATAPGLPFAANTATGFYRPAANTLGFVTASVERVRIDSSGNVGIGTTSPSSRLHTLTASGENKLIVEASATSQTATLSLQTNNTTPGQCIVYMGHTSASTNGQVGYDPGTDALYLFTNNTERMRINSSGNVGIGTTSPSAKLDVSGIIRLFATSLTVTDQAASRTITFPNRTGTVATTTMTVQVFTSGSGTYTTPAECTAIWVRLVGGGGGGGGSGNDSATGNGVSGGDSTFGSVVGNGGSGGPNTYSGGFSGGQGGSSSGGDINTRGGGGGTTPGNSSPDLFQNYGGNGGNSVFGGGAAGAHNGAGATGAVGTHGGGGSGIGGNSSVRASAGGGGGGYSEKLIVSPNATYAYAVGAGGSGGAAGSGGGTGGAGGAGLIIVQEYY